jgi:hypothetical protein
MRRTLLLSLASGLCVLSLARQAEAAATKEAVLSGGAIMWKGYVSNNLNKNVIIVAPGDALINGTITHIDGATWITKTEVGISNANAVFCTDVSNGVQGKLAAYYVYFAAQTAGGYVSVISGTAPHAEGYPKSGLTFTYNSNTTTNTTQAVFLGSYLTDSGSEMVPFRRIGSDVYLLWSGATTQLVVAPGAIATQYNGSNTPTVASYDLTGGSVSWPKSATSAIVGVSSASNTAGNVLGILDPALLTLGTNPKNWNPFFSWSAPVQNSLTVQASPDRVRIPVDSSGNASIVDLTPPTSTENVALALEGYVEVAHHLY